MEVCFVICVSCVDGSWDNQILGIMYSLNDILRGTLARRGGLLVAYYTLACRSLRYGTIEPCGDMHRRMSMPNPIRSVRKR